MRLTDRDVRVMRDIALSHATSRDQLIDLGYFSSVTRANTRLRLLSAFSLVRRLETPFLTQALYTVGQRARQVVGARLSALLKSRQKAPRFLQHALSTTNVRIELLKRGATDWRFEQQLWSSFRFAGKDYLLKPDGLAITPEEAVAVEVDLGHVAPVKFREKLRTYDAFLRSGECERQWNIATFRILTVTSGELRARRLTKLVDPNAPFTFQCVPHEELNVTFPGAWS